ncbi:hypothetical protein C0Q44_00525 [Paenibacillus sp. PCH8]|uniref:AVAST type 1 anti-phage system MBL fold metallo-hydrolase Avs1a n=1 Tax=Paenibacillus sp. PCH8 TaxID=2066524 RepID=UPI000CFA46D7|nr:AVAST type 1 anti-phage system MBL fold metallo-hydrolase Avs1a [Paenibacillus sp. PCH8]PQP83252.1 hypothetical protein C0Q44_00525 [Paenibacillus sp. PCH8]
MNSNIQIEVFPASEGDAFLLSFDETHILIDVGVYNTYHNFVKARIESLAKDLGKIDLMVVTHIDQDHIEGAIELITENGSSTESSLIQIDQVWHNSYRHLQFSKENQLKEAEKEILREIISNGKKHIKQTSNESQEISAKQGSSLASLLLAGRYSWNSSFQGEAINLDSFDNVSFPNFSLRLLSPDTSKLERLSKKWEKELLKKKYNFTFSKDKIFDDAFEFGLLMGSSTEEKESHIQISREKIQWDVLLSEDDEKNDKSPTNGSSIAFIIEAQKKKMLFLGDAHQDIVIKQLENIKEESEDRIYFDLVKISHHGSSNNTNTKLLNLIDCPKFIISTDGSKHGHPDLSTLAKIIQNSRGNEIKIYCNYITQNSKIVEDLIEKNNNNCTIVYPSEDGVLKIEV